jgi:hypothetical protein
VEGPPTMIGTFPARIAGRGIPSSAQVYSKGQSARLGIYSSTLIHQMDLCFAEVLYTIYSRTHPQSAYHFA